MLPDGAFYAWADCSAACAKLGVNGSWDFAFEVMNRAHVAVTPGRDFGSAQTAHFIRFSTAYEQSSIRGTSLTGQSGNGKQARRFGKKA